MYHVATFPEFLSEPYESPLSADDAWEWLVRAAQSGWVQAQYDVGAALATGEWREKSVLTDHEAALASYRRAAEAGHSEAQYNLGLMVWHGEGCEADREAGTRWLRVAVAGGHHYAARVLADLESSNRAAIGTPRRHGGFDSPESAAMADFPPKFCHLIASRSQGDDAYVLLDTGPSDRPYLYGIHCRRENGRRIEGGSSNAPSWEQRGHAPDVGTLAYWDEAPNHADMVRVEFDGDVVEEAVTGRGFLAVWWRVPEPQTSPRVLALRIAGRWVES